MTEQNRTNSANDAEACRTNVGEPKHSESSIDQAAAEIEQALVPLVSQPDLRCLENELDELAKEQLIERIKLCERCSILFARHSVLCEIAAGLACIRIKKVVDHGRWENWVDTHLPGKLRSVQRWMKRAKDKDRLLALAPSELAELSGRQATKLLQMDDAARKVGSGNIKADEDKEDRTSAVIDDNSRSAKVPKKEPAVQDMEEDMMEGMENATEDDTLDGETHYASLGGSPPEDGIVANQRSVLNNLLMELPHVATVISFRRGSKARRAVEDMAAMIKLAAIRYADDVCGGPLKGKEIHPIVVAMTLVTELFKAIPVEVMFCPDNTQFDCATDGSPAQKVLEAMKAQEDNAQSHFGG